MNRKIATTLKSTFGFTRLPFSVEPGSGECFEYDGFTKALGKLDYLASRRGMGVLFGDPGTGKTTLLRAFIDSLGKTTSHVAYITDTTSGVRDLYRQIAWAFGLEPSFRKSDLVREIKARLLHISRTQRICPILVIDEAHLLSRSIFEELRIIANFDADSHDELVLILAGHNQLEARLRLGINEALWQRIIIRERLKDISREETAQYVSHRLSLAGRTAPLFTPDALEAIHKGGRGIFRVIDRIAETALLIALDDEVKEIDSEIITRAIEEVMP
jgi:type II secretory pathway predicted ATPase ExeA